MKRFAPLLLAFLFGACGGPPPAETPREGDLYRGLADPLPGPDATLLAGYRVLIDPGHGGNFRGTAGRDSLEESHVNLGVALYLWGLLREAGADVHLTRAVDRDFLTLVDSSLTSDLEARVAMVDSLEPDVFLSIHHNAQPQRDPSVNSVETYYKAGDPASLDLAFSIHRHLMRNLGIDAGEVRQGNYYVLRNVGVAAVLGESSYLTHPPVEEKLRLSFTQQLEAQAYFLGIVDYCRRGIPRVTAIEPADSLHQSVPVIAGAFEDRGGAGIDPDGVHFLVNGDPVEPALSADGLRATWRMPWDAPNGAYEVRVSARNLRGNTSTIRAARFRLEHPPAMAAIETVPARVPAGGGSVRVRARVLDRRGMPVADGTEVHMRTSLGGASVHAPVAGGAVEFALDVPRGRRAALAVTLSCGGAEFKEEIPVEAGATSPWRTVTVRDARTGKPVTGARIVLGDSVLVTGSPSGSYGFAAAGDVRPQTLAPGYRPAAVESMDTLAIQPWFDGALLGKRFVLDPEGGTPRQAGVGPMGLSASHVNLRVADYLAGFLHAAGARALLTRTGDETRLAEDIARMTNRFRADRYIEIRHPALPGDSAPAVRTFHFPGSANGEKMARTLGDAMAARLGRAHRGPAPLVTYPLQQTACPAIVVAAPPISDPDEESRLHRAQYQREQAYAIFLGILRHYGVECTGTLEVAVNAGDRRDWMVTLDGTWTLSTGDDGVVRFECVPPGAHEIHVRRADRLFRSAVTTAEGGIPVRLSVETAAP